MFVIGVTRTTGKLLVTSLFKGVGTLEDAEPRRERNSTWEVQQGYKNRWEFQLEWSSFVCGPVMGLVLRVSVKSSDSKDWAILNSWMNVELQNRKFCPSWTEIFLGTNWDKYNFLFLSSSTYTSSRQVNSAVQETVSCWAPKFSKTQ